MRQEGGADFEEYDAKSHFSTEHVKYAPTFSL